MGMDEEERELRSPQDVTAEKALLLLMRKDPPGTRYWLDYHRVAMGRGELTKVWILTPVAKP